MVVRRAVQIGIDLYCLLLTAIRSLGRQTYRLLAFIVRYRWLVTLIRRRLLWRRQLRRPWLALLRLLRIQIGKAVPGHVLDSDLVVAVRVLFLAPVLLLLTRGFLLLS